MLFCCLFWLYTYFILVYLPEEFCLYFGFIFTNIRKCWECPRNNVEKWTLARGLSFSAVMPVHRQNHQEMTMSRGLYEADSVASPDTFWEILSLTFLTCDFSSPLHLSALFFRFDNIRGSESSRLLWRPMVKGLKTTSVSQCYRGATSKQTNHVEKNKWQNISPFYVLLCTISLKAPIRTI